MGSARSAVQTAVSIAALAAVRARRSAARAAASRPAPAAAAPVPAAAAAPAPGNPARGKAISYTCLGCHGIDGYKNAYPMYSVPKLEGQHPDYLAAALHEYREGDRAHLTMHSQASTLSDQDIADIATYFAGKPLTPERQGPGQRAPGGQLVHLLPRRRTGSRSRRSIRRSPASTRTTSCARSMSTRRAAARTRS